MQPRGLPLWLRRARELVEGLQNTQAATHPETFRPPPWLRLPWERESEPAPTPSWRPPPRAPTQPQPQAVRSPQPSSSKGKHIPTTTIRHSAQQAPPTTAPHPEPSGPLPSEIEAGNRMRDVLRNVAQPVVIAVTEHGNTFHGATLTSFASLTLQPHPLIAFSLRLPSRLADCLRDPAQSDCAPGNFCAPPATPTRLTITLLSGANEGVADALAKPGHEGIFDGWGRREGLPYLRDGVGGLLCQVVHTVPLRDVGGDTMSDSEGSELFVCRVLDAWKGEGEDSLVHFRREYGSVKEGM